MPFVLAVTPNKIRPRGTQFYGGAVLVVRTTGVGVGAKERVKGRYSKYVDGSGWIKHAVRHINIIGVPALGTFFGENYNAGSPYNKGGTTIKLGDTRSHFICDHGKHERHFMHGSSLMPEIHLYVGHGYFNTFFTFIHKLLRDKVHYAFLSAYSIDPSAATTEPHVIPSKP